WPRSSAQVPCFPGRRLLRPWRLRQSVDDSLARRGAGGSPHQPLLAISVDRRPRRAWTGKPCVVGAAVLVEDDWRRSEIRPGIGTRAAPSYLEGTPRSKAMNEPSRVPARQRWKEMRNGQTEV